MFVFEELTGMDVSCTENIKQIEIKKYTYFQNNIPSWLLGIYLGHPFQLD